ncbi:MAG: hypothetical protein RJB52_811 [Pseudomonadota bacterium]
MSISSLHERHKRPMRFAIQSSFISLLAVGLSACSSFSSMTASDKVDYKKQGEVRGPNLALPPDLITAAISCKMALPRCPSTAKRSKNHRRCAQTF